MTVSTRPAAIARGSSERLVSAAEIVENEIQCKGMAVVLKLLAEGVREPREPPHAHSHGKVLSLGT